MADIHVRREHRLGLATARKMAWQWAEAVEQKFGMECTVIEGDDSDVVEFRGAGVDGRLLVAADSFDLTARLGLLVGVFRDRIEAEIESNLDVLLARSAAQASKAKPKAPAKAAAPRTKEKK
jgi:putative polyhydroxyalkanoate system protein